VAAACVAAGARWGSRGKTLYLLYDSGAHAVLSNFSSRRDGRGRRPGHVWPGARAHGRRTCAAPSPRSPPSPPAAT